MALNSGKIVLLFAAFFVLLSTAGAETMSGEYAITYYQDAPVERVMVFKNTDSAARSFSLDIVGEKTLWSYVTPTKETIQGFCASSQDIVLCTAPSDFSLAGNTEREVYFFSKAKTYARPGIYNVDALSSGAAIGTFAITIQQGHTVDLTVESAQQNAGQCEPKTFNLAVSNSGRFDDEVAVNVAGIAAEWVSVSEKSFILGRGAEKNITLSVQAPCNQELKNYEFDVIAAIPRADFSISKRLSFSLENKQGFSIADLEGGNLINACKETGTTQAVRITNNGRLEDELDLSLNAPEWVSLSEKKITVAPGATRTLEITAAKTEAEEKQYSLELSVKSAKFANTGASKTISLDLKDCYNVQISEVSGSEKACLTDNVEFEFLLQNNREKAIALQLGVSGLNARIDKPSVKIEPGQSETVKASLNLSGETAGAKELVLNISSDYFSLNQKYGIELVKCFLGIEPEKQVVDVNVSVGALTRIVVTNKTLTQEHIKAFVRGKDWILFEPKEFSLQPDEKKDVYVYVSPPFNSIDEMQKAEITMRSDRYAASKAIDLNVFGGTEIGKADVLIGGFTIREIGSVKEIILTVNLKNDSNVSVTVNDINSPSVFDTSFSMRDRRILANESNPVELTIRLPKGFDQNQFSVPLEILTEQGSFNRFVLIDLNPKPQADKNAAGTTQTIPVGLAFLTQPKNILIIAVIVALIALIVYLALKGKDEDETQQAEGTETEAHEGIESIAEEIKAKPKRKRKAKKKKR